MITITPIKGCAWQHPDRTCFHEDNPTPECHTGACPRLAPHIGDALDAYGDMLAALGDALEMAEHLYDTFGEIHGDLYPMIERLRAEIAKAKGA